MRLQGILKEIIGRSDAHYQQQWKGDNQRIKELQILPYTAWFTYNIATMNYRNEASIRP